MRTLVPISLLVLSLLMACAPGQPVPTVEVPSSIQTGVAQAPTLAGTVSAAARAAATEAARQASTVVPSAGTEAAKLAGTVVPAAGTSAANAAATVIPGAQTAAPGVATSGANALATVVPGVQTAAPGVATAITTPLAGASLIQVKLTEFKIDMPASVHAGLIAFHVTNNGTTEHNFEIKGQDVDQKFDNNLQPGELNVLAVDLKPGTYDVFCPVDGHKDQGMKLTLTVTAQ